MDLGQGEEKWMAIRDKAERVELVTHIGRYRP
jgi:hypothetical protein